MGRATAASLALIVRNHPWRNRAARADLDLALAAAAMDFRIEVYFLGAALLQLAAERDSRPALLSKGYRGWAALPELAETRVYAEQEWLDRCARHSIPLILAPQGLSVDAMQGGWRHCRHLIMV